MQNALMITDCQHGQTLPEETRSFIFRCGAACLRKDFLHSLIVPAILSVLAVFSLLTPVYARPGLSTGVYVGMATEPGPMTQDMDDRSAFCAVSYYMIPPSSSIINPEYSKEYAKIIDGSWSLQYEFKDGFFIRSGADFASTIGHSSAKYHNQSTSGPTDNDYSFSTSQQTLIIPLYAGFSFYPKKGDIGIYGALGIAGGYSHGKIDEKMTTYNYGTYISTSTIYDSGSSSSPVFGMTGLIGVEGNFWKDISITFEYVFSNISETKSQKGSAFVSGSGTYPCTSSATFGFPTQLLRIGTRYVF